MVVEREIVCNECGEVPRPSAVPYCDEDFRLICDCDEWIDISDSVDGNPMFDPMEGQWSPGLGEGGVREAAREYDTDDE